MAGDAATSTASPSSWTERNSWHCESSGSGSRQREQLGKCCDSFGGACTLIQITMPVSRILSVYFLPLKPVRSYPNLSFLSCKAFHPPLLPEGGALPRCCCFGGCNHGFCSREPVDQVLGCLYLCVCVCQLTPVSRDTTLFYCTKLRRGAMDHYHSLPNEDSDSLVVISRRDAIWTYLQGF